MGAIGDFMIPLSESEIERVLVKVGHHGGELFPSAATNLETLSWVMKRLCNKRSTVGPSSLEAMQKASRAESNGVYSFAAARRDGISCKIWPGLGYTGPDAEMGEGSDDEDQGATAGNLLWCPGELMDGGVRGRRKQSKPNTEGYAHGDGGTGLAERYDRAVAASHSNSERN
jgi:hypothetical protein